jgi:hypothetical protein
MAGTTPAHRGAAQPVQRIVLFAFKPEVGEEQRQRVIAGQAALQGVIPGLLGMTIGPNVSDNRNEYSHAWAMLFDSEQSLAGYMVHPAHRAQIQRAAPYRKHLVAANFLVTAYEPVAHEGAAA